MEKLTFKQYVESREQLLKAIDNVPVTVMEYEVRKYCNMVLGESTEPIQLKPKHYIRVTWMCQNPLLPIPEMVQVIQSGVVTHTLPVTINSDKLQKWLIRHTHEGINHGHKI